MVSLERFRSVPLWIATVLVPLVCTRFRFFSRSKGKEADGTDGKDDALMEDGERVWAACARPGRGECLDTALDLSFLEDDDDDGDTGGVLPGECGVPPAPRPLVSAVPTRSMRFSPAFTSMSMRFALLPSSSSFTATVSLACPSSISSETLFSDGK